VAGSADGPSGVSFVALPAPPEAIEEPSAPPRAADPASREVPFLAIDDGSS
jgi:hypothetical protein